MFMGVRIGTVRVYGCLHGLCYVFMGVRMGTVRVYGCAYETIYIMLNRTKILHILATALRGELFRSQKHIFKS